jgi:SAM-dependent methyltransferase
VNVLNRLDSHRASYTAEFPYYEENYLTHVAYAGRIAKMLCAIGAKSMLSLGIGHRVVAQRILDLLSAGALEKYVIIEGSPAIIAAFRSELGSLPRGLELIEGYFETFEYPYRFDLIEAGFVLEHVDDPALVLSRLRDFMVPGGRILIAVPNARSLHRVLGNMARLLPDLYALSQADLALGHQRYFDLASLTDLVHTCGYEVIRAEGLLLKPFTTAQLKSLNLTPAVWDALLEVAADYPEIAHAIYLEARA